jgi:hypothetical protein
VRIEVDSVEENWGGMAGCEWHCPGQEQPRSSAFRRVRTATAMK